MDLAPVKNPAGLAVFGLRVRRLREQRKLSQQALADMADVSKLTIQRLELAKFSVTLDVLISLTRAFEIPLQELMDCPGIDAVDQHKQG
ncbi:helix-turn-helix transcriptional regulator [Hymenobacter sp. BT442]|uniref:Helix-turn-helix transcriptional regulator n=2 Tax=Hymenobacter negativus TaxID=2795026 RepID=A0ABS0Q5I7_9BACT|nr:helix-turn-helix transcriptional regulator [Hymenobacter negativus]